MSTLFPTALDDFSNPSPTSPRSNPSLANGASGRNDAIEALQAKVGADSSAVATSLDYRTRALEAASPTTAQGRTFVPASGTAGTAINAAIAALPANGGRIVLGGGTHVIDTAVLINKTVIIEGMGVGVTLLSFDAAAVPTALAMADTTQRQVFLRDFRINTTTASDNTGTAIDASYFFDSVIERILIGSSSNQTPNVGIKFNAVGTYYNTVTDCRIVVGGASSVGVLIGSNANDNAVRNTKIAGDAAASTSIRINTAHSTVIDHLSSDTAGMAIGIDLQTGANDTTMIGCYLEGLDIGLKIASGVESVRYIGGYIAASLTANIQDLGAAGLTIDNTWVQFDPYSSIDRTGVVKNKVNGVSVPTNAYQADDLAVIAWTYDPAYYQAGTLITNGSIYLARVKLRYAATITNLLIGVTAVAVTPTAGQSFLGLYNSAGTQVGLTADIGTALAAGAGLLSAALTAPYAAAAGDYWVALVANAATAPTIARIATGVNFGIVTLNATAATRRWAVNGTAATALPGSFSPASNSTSGALTIWAAVS